MKIHTVLGYAVAALLVVVFASLFLGYLLGHPVLLAHVDADSMEPTLNEGDGFIAVPAPVAGDVETGDVVVFEAEGVQDGRITTHRVVGERSGGYVTQGDNNPFDDQSQGEPAVTDGQIKAVALAVGDDPVRIPHLGTAIGLVGTAIGTVTDWVTSVLGLGAVDSEVVALGLFGLGLLVFALLFTGNPNDRRQRERARTRARDAVMDTRVVLLLVIVLLCAGATIGMVAPAGTETFGIVSTEGASSSPTVIPVGETQSHNETIHNGGVVPTVSYFEPRSDGIEMAPDQIRLQTGEQTNATVAVTAPDETGYVLRSYTEHRYIAVFPSPVMDALHSIHPWVPYAVINGLIALAVVLVWTVIGPATQLRGRTRRRAAHNR